MALMDNKAAMYRSVEEHNKEGHSIVTIPSYRVVNNAEDFKNAYEEMKVDGSRLCIKPVVGEGASGFRMLDDEADTISFLLTRLLPKKYLLQQPIKHCKSKHSFQIDGSRVFRWL